MLGYLDDLILLPGLIWLTIRLLPPDVLADSRAQAERLLDASAGRPRSLAGAIAIIVIWVAVAGVLLWWVMSLRG